MTEPILSDSAELRRIDLTGTVWFAAASIASALGVAGALSAGWSPLDLPVGLAIAWWVSAAVLVASLGLLAWSGCPVLGDSVSAADRVKSLTIRFGVVAFLAGGSATAFVMLLTPEVA